MRPDFSSGYASRVGAAGTYHVRGPQVAPARNGASVDLVKLSGTVTFKLPGHGPFFTRLDRQQVPLGSTIVATHGNVRLQAARPSGAIEAADLAGGTLVKVTHAKLSVQDLIHKITVTLHAGHSYFAGH